MTDGVPPPESTQVLAPGTFLRDVVAPEYGRRIADLRARIRRLQEDLADRESATTSVRMVIAGEGGGCWFLNVSAGVMEVAEEPTCPVLFSCHQSYEDWRALTSRGSMFGGGGHSGGDATGAAGPFSSSRLSRLRALSGTVQLVLRPESGRAQEHTVLLHFGAGEPASPPQVVVSMDEKDATDLRVGKLDPQAAFLQGRVKISGDVGLAVQLGTALFL